MIQSLSSKYRKAIAWPLFVIFYIQLLLPITAAARIYPSKSYGHYNKGYYYIPTVNGKNNFGEISNKENIKKSFIKDKGKNPFTGVQLSSPEKVNIGGPSSPEATSFKAVGSNNLVSLANGDFSYSVPLLDVGGYPVNLFYSGGVGMEQEASWVGLGWNINPGTVSRNMRGVPDDFNGTDLMTQTQHMKPNRTWGGDVAVDVEYVGIKFPKIGLGGSIGFSYNNYLGPALEVGGRVSLTLSTSKTVEAEKTAPAALGLTVGVGAKLNSRSGLTFSPSISASGFMESAHLQGGIGLSTSYNSRSGISGLNLHAETSVFMRAKEAEYKVEGDKESGIKKQSHGTASSGSSLGSTTITFAKPSYTPSLRMPMQNSYYSGQLELGGGFFGFRGAVTAMGYYSESKVPTELRVVQKPMVGYLYSEKANSNADAVMDFNRLNDAEVTPNTPIISAPQYNYDIFSVQGEGTGGSIRAYRGDMGFVRDNVTVSKEKNLSIGVDLGVPFHLGINWNSISTPTRVGGWEDGNNTLLQTLKFKPRQSNSTLENVYFRNPGEATVTSEEALNRVGRDNLVRFALSGSNSLPRLESSLEQFDKITQTKKASNLSLVNKSLQNREKRTQITTMLTADEASKIGLEKMIRNYRSGSSEFDGTNSIVYDSISRIDTGSVGFRKAHHISEITVLEQTGMRYVYGLPVYNLKQKDFTFSVEGLGDTTNIVGFSSDEPTTNSHNMNNGSKIDGFLQIQETPAYASSFLITGLLSPDFVDVTGDGITEDDLGGAVKFNYTKSSSLHKWRTPRNNSTAATGHFNEGIKTENKDNKALITYGEREAWYLNSIESKSMIAVFTTSARDDAKGVQSDMDGRINSSEDANKKLSRIDLYTKSEIKTKGITNAKPIKSVYFEYGYSLCTGSPDNKNSAGKLTLKSVYFTYNGLNKRMKDRYVFNYGDTTSRVDNPNYALNSSDRWGTYKPKRDPVSSANNNPGNLTNADYPFTISDKAKNDKYAGAWCLKKILLPSGGQMEMQYEADDYAYVQDRRACNMFKIYGLGATTSYSSNNSLYNSGLNGVDNYYVYIQIPQPLQSTGSSNQKAEIYAKYLDGISQPGGKKQLAFKLMMNMPKGAEPLTVYAEYDDYGLCANSSNKDYIYLHLKSMDGKSPLATSAIGFLTENIPGQAFPGYEVDVNGVAAFFEIVGGMLNGLKNAFKNVNEQMRDASKAKTIYRDSSFVRLANPQKMKYGGGYRIKRILVKDNWNAMSGQYNSVYGQDYDYTKTEKIYNKDTTISSGVASYEPGIGSEENPFREILSFSNKMPLASAQYGAIEMPMLEGLYSSPSVVYSKVTVRSIHRKGTHGDSSLRSAIGKQITEFYTAREFPAYSTYTPMNIMDYNKNPFFSFFYKEIINRRTISQGFLVETNDMHGKMKSQIAYSERDEKTPISASYYTYKNTGKNGLNDKVDFVYNNESGAIHAGNMGVDVELMTDVREFSIKSNGFNGQLQIDLFTFGPITIPLPTFFPLKTYLENKYRAVTCTKLINYHAIEDSVVVMDKGSVISTKTIAYDAETGSPLVTKTANEFNDPVYTASYPAYWAYTGAGPAYKNIDRYFTNVNFYDGRIQGSSIDQDASFESGDELFIIKQGSDSLGCIPASANTYKIWAVDKYRLAGITPPGGGGGGGGGGEEEFGPGVPAKDLVFIDANGYPFTKSGVSFRIVRSGKRNNLGLTAFSSTSMATPVYHKKFSSNPDTLLVNNNTKVVAASASEYKEIWQTDNDVFTRKQYYYICSVEYDSLSCNGIPQKNINPYLKGLIGNFKPYRSYTYYSDRDGIDTISTTAIRKNGYMKDFSSFWNFDTSTSMLKPDTANTKWVWNSELTKVNIKGQELETRDALNRYTAAQYGFNNNMAVALVQNSRNGESFSEGFEDYLYNETINKSQYNVCTDRYINFSGLTHGNIVNAANYGIAAHTGRNVLRVDSNSQVTKTISINNKIIDSFNLHFDDGVVLGPTGPYLSSGKLYSLPTDQPSSDILDFYYGSSLGMGFEINKYVNSLYVPTLDYDAGSHQVRFWAFYKTRQYFKVTTPNTHTFTLNARQDVHPIHAGETPPAPIVSITALQVVVKRLNGEIVMSKTIYSQSPYGTQSWQSDNTGSQSVYLDCGEYMVDAYPSSDVRADSSFVLGAYYFHDFHSKASYTCSPSLNSYTPGCEFTKPIPGKDSLLNQVYKLKPGKKMQFSAWVKEPCDAPCIATDFTNSSIEVRSNGLNIGNLRRTGTIIEGWQKIEGEFTLPTDSSTAQLKFINSSTTDPMYVDDIRIHPYNANMKSYVYDPRTMRLRAELDENNYASFYEYDEEGQLIRVKKETILGIKTIKESRSAKQKSITDLQ